MLEARYSEWDSCSPNSYAALMLDELCALVDRFAAAPPVSSYVGGASGAHACMSVIDHGFVLHAYFGEDCRGGGVVEFELYGPYPPGTERNHGDRYDGRGLVGRMTTVCLKGVLLLLDEGHSPVDYVRESALMVSAVADD
jgi:hypothetical protein